MGPVGGTGDVGDVGAIVSILVQNNQLKFCCDFVALFILPNRQFKNANFSNFSSYKLNLCDKKRN